MTGLEPVESVDGAVPTRGAPVTRRAGTGLDFPTGAVGGRVGPDQDAAQGAAGSAGGALAAGSGPVPSGQLPTPPSAGPSAGLSGSAAGYVARAAAGNTRRAYASDWARFESWCARTGGTALPAAPETVASYLAEAADLHRLDGGWAYSPASLSRWVAAINKRHETAGQALPGGHPLVASVLRGVRRDRAQPPRRARPLSVPDLRRLLAGIDLYTWPSGLIGRRDAALLLIGFTGALRRAELAGLRWADLTAHAEDGLHLLIRASKTDPDAAGQVLGLPYGTTSVTCCPCALTRWRAAVAAYATGGRRGVLALFAAGEPAGHVCRTHTTATVTVELGGLDPEQPVFPALTKAGTIRATAIGGETVSAVLRRRLTAAGLPVTGYSAHSLRAGFATAAARAGASHHEIMHQTRHRDPRTVQGYIRDNAPLEHNAVTRLGL